MEVLHKLRHESIIKLYLVLRSNSKDLSLEFKFMEADMPRWGGGHEHPLEDAPP
jgi:hypothetical protein